jgi:hypothetical protein
MAEDTPGGPTVTDPTPPAGDDLAPPDYCDPVIEAYKKDVDRTLLRENLKLTVEERFEKHRSFMEFFHAMREAGRKHREGHRT